MRTIPGRMIGMRRKDSRLEALRSIEILRDLPARQLRRLSDLVDEVSVTPGTVLIRQGQLNRHAYFVRSGALGVEVDGDHVATVTSGSVVGERSAVLHTVANATVTADEESTILALDHRALLGAAAQDPDFGVMLRDLAEGRTNQAA